MPPPHIPSKLRKKVEWLFRRAEGALLSDAVRDGAASHLDPDGARLALLAMEDDLRVTGDDARWVDLARAQGDAPGGEARARYAARYGVAGVRRFGSERAPGARVYRLEIETFPRHVNNVYLALEEGSSLLFDCGSGLPSSNRDLALAFAVLADVHGESARWEDLDWCVVSHAHSDHFGGVNHLRRTSRARVAVHELDARVISAFEERMVLATRDMEAYWRRAGVPADERDAMRELYAAHKRLFRTDVVDRTLRDRDTVGPGYVVHHVPGHCPGLVCLQVHDVLLTSDHVLARITPHQFPQAIMPFAGLGHYFQSLAKIRALEGISYALGGHEEAIGDLRARIDEIARFHEARLERVLAICEAPQTVRDVARAMFGDQDGYGVILAVDEAGAHVEYLHQLGRLRGDNLGELASPASPASPEEPAYRYVTSASAAGRPSGA